MIILLIAKTVVSFEEGKYKSAETKDNLDKGGRSGLAPMHMSPHDFIEADDTCESSSVYSQPEDWQFLSIYTLMNYLILAKKQIPFSATSKASPIQIINLTVENSGSNKLSYPMIQHQGTDIPNWPP